MAPLDMSGQAWTCIKREGVVCKIYPFLIGQLQPSRTGQAVGLQSRPGEGHGPALTESGKMANQKRIWGPCQWQIEANKSSWLGLDSKLCSNIYLGYPVALLLSASHTTCTLPQKLLALSRTLSLQKNLLVHVI